MRALLLGGSWLVPIIVGIVVGAFVRSRALARAIGLAVAALLVPVAFVVFVSSEADLLTTASVRALAIPALEVDGLSAVLLPLVASLSLAVLVASPRADLDARAVASLLVAEAATLGVLVAANVLLLALFWALSLLPMAMEARRSADAALRRAVGWAFATCIVPMLAVVATVVVLAIERHLSAPFDLYTIIASGILDHEARVLAPLLLVACTARMGIVPFHLWVPIAFSRGRLAVMLPAVVSPIGSYALVRLALGLFPAATGEWCGTLTVMATVSALYGAVLALGQNDARRQLGYLWTSMAGFVLGGVATLDARGLSGALMHDIALIVAMTGLAVTVRSVEARTGTADFRRLGSLVLHAPRMATGYFLLGLAAVGFPATVTFVSEDLVVAGLVKTRIVVAVILLVTMAINGVTLVRSFKRIFLGPRSPHERGEPRVHDLLPRERWVSLALVLALLAGGFVPTPLLSIRRQVEHGALGRGVDPKAEHPWASRGLVSR